MAKAIKEYGRKVVDGVEIFEVGVEQFRTWINWKLCASRLSCNFRINGLGTQSAAKGRWVVIECNTMFGGGSCGTRLKVVYDCKTRREAVHMCKHYIEHDTYSQTYVKGGKLLLPARGKDFEVWHLVDDGDLWQEWDIEAAAAGGDLQAAQMWADTFHDDTYLQKIEQQYTGDYHVYDTTVGDWPGVCIADVTQYDLAHGYKYVYEHWTESGELLKQCVEDTEGASITCGWYRDRAWHVVSSDVTSISTWEGLEVLRDDGTAPVWCPLRVCFVCWSAED